MSSKPIHRPSVTRRQLLSGAAAVSSLAVLRMPSALAATQLRWGSAAVGTSGYVIIEALANAVNQHTDIQNSAMATAGGGENPALIGMGQLDLGQTNTANYIEARKGLPPYPSAVDAEQMFSYAMFSVPLVTRADSGITTLDDLKGKRVALGPSGGAPAGTWKTVFEAAGIDADVRKQFMGWGDAMNAVQTGAVDAAVAIIQDGKPVGVVQRLEQAQDISVIPVSDEVMSVAREANPGVVNAKLEPELWPTVSEPTNSPGFANMLVADGNLSEELGYQITRAIYENAEEIRQIDRRLGNIEPAYGVRYLLTGYPVHPGAARYFKEAGVWRDDLTIAE